MIGPIEKGVALPHVRRRKHPEIDYASILNSMSVSDSRKVSERYEQCRLLLEAKRLGYKIVTEKQTKGGWRVWLISRPNGVSFHHTSLHFKAPHTTAPHITSHQ